MEAHGQDTQYRRTPLSDLIRSSPEALHCGDRRYCASARPGHATTSDTIQEASTFPARLIRARLKSQFRRSGAGEQRRFGRTIAHLMQLDVSDKGKLIGRVLTEALPNGTLPAVTSRILASKPASAQRARHGGKHADGW